MTEEQARTLVDVVAALVTRVESIGYEFRSDHCIFCGAYRGYVKPPEEHRRFCATLAIGALQGELRKDVSK